MSKPQLFHDIESLLPYLSLYRTKGTVTIPKDDQLLMKKIWENDIMRTSLNVSCSSCLLHALNIMASYYEREYDKYLKTLPQPEPVKPTEPIVEPDAITIDKKKPCKSCKQSKDTSK